MHFLKLTLYLARPVFHRDMASVGVVPASGSIDCVSVFSQNVSDGCTIAMVRLHPSFGLGF